MSGWIKLHRQLRDWEWYKDHPTCKLFFHLLLSANHKPARWQGIAVNTGECITGLNSLADQTGLSVRQIRTALDKLKATNEVTIRSNNKYSIISIVKWSDYQGDDSQDDKQMTGKWQTDDKPATTNKNDNNNKNERIPPKSPKGYTFHFEAFWSVYPRKVNKLAASRAYQTALKQPGADYETLNRIAADFAAAHRSAGTEERFIPHPATWLNKGGWESDLTGIKPGTGAMPAAANARGSQFGAVKSALAELLAENNAGTDSGRSGIPEWQGSAPAFLPAPGNSQWPHDPADPGRDDPTGRQIIDHDPAFPADG